MRSTIRQRAISRWSPGRCAHKRDIDFFLAKSNGATEIYGKRGRVGSVEATDANALASLVFSQIEDRTPFPARN